MESQIKETETPPHECRGVLAVVPPLHTLLGRGTLVETNKTLSRPALTVQDVTVDSVRHKTYPSAGCYSSLRLAPISRHCCVCSQRREERGSPALGLASCGLTEPC